MTISTVRRKSLCADGWTVHGSRNHSKPSICWWSTCGDIQGKSHTNALWVKGAELQAWMEKLGLCREKSSTDAALPDRLSTGHLVEKIPSLLENFHVCFIIQLRQVTSFRRWDSRDNLSHFLKFKVQRSPRRRFYTGHSLLKYWKALSLTQLGITAGCQCPTEFAIGFCLRQKCTSTVFSYKSRFI